MEYYETGWRRVFDQIILVGMISLLGIYAVVVILQAFGFEHFQDFLNYLALT